MFKTLDFETNKVETLTMEELKATYKENDIYGKPLKEYYHFEAIESLQNEIDNAGLKSNIAQLFAAQNRDRTQPGVVILPQAEEKYGPKAMEAHILRRIYCNINIADFDDEDYSTNIAIAFHQQGIQVVYGNMVKICTNQVIMHGDQYFSTYGKESMKFKDIIDRVKDWLFNSPERMIMAEREMLTQMENILILPEEMTKIIGLLSMARILHDTDHKAIRMNDTYPLNQGQISTFVEDLVLLSKEQDRLSLLDVYNTATNLYKPHIMEIPNIMVQSVAMSDFLRTNYLS